MNEYKIAFLLSLLFLHLSPLVIKAQNEIVPPVPTAVITDKEGGQEELGEGGSVEGEAPLSARFMGNADEYDDYSLVCTWTFTREDEYEPFLTRYDANVDYEFREAGTFSIKFNATYTHRTNPNLVLEYEFEPFYVRIAESSLKVPNAFSPNGDGINDYFNVFDVKSIVSFTGAIYNRWGQQLFTWGIDEIGCEECGWDGTYKGKPVKDGVYFVVVSARGADGIEYEIKADVNVLRGFIDEVSTE